MIGLFGFSSMKKLGDPSSLSSSSSASSLWRLDPLVEVVKGKAGVGCCLEVAPDLEVGGTIQLVLEYPFLTLLLSTFDGPLDRPPKTGKIPLSGLAAVIGNAGVLGIGGVPFPPKPTAPTLDGGARKISPEKKERIVLIDLMLTPLRKVGEDVLLGACGRASTDVDVLRMREEVLNAVC